MPHSGKNCWLPMESLDLDTNQVHVLVASLDAASSRIKDWESLLTVPEIQRADRFRPPLSRSRFICSRGILRHMLGLCMDLPPQSLEFFIGAHGKPELAPKCGIPQLHFNQAHSGGLALYALTRVCPLGVDLEQVRPLDFLEDLVGGIMTLQEINAWNQLANEKRLNAFYSLWTRKEAVLKAVGAGIGEHLRDVMVSFTPDAAPSLVHGLQGVQPGEEWLMEDLKPQGGYAAALAMPQRNIRLHCWRFES